MRSTDIQFNLPGSHGQIFAWALPSIGISDEVARSLEAKLQKQLSLAIQRHVDDLERSQTSSPASSHQNIGLVDSDWRDDVLGFMVDSS